MRKRAVARGAGGQRVKKYFAITTLPETAVQQDDDPAIGGAADQAPEPLAQTDDRLGHGIFVEGVFVQATAGGVERIGGNGEGQTGDYQADKLIAGQVDPFPIAAGAKQERTGVGAEVAQIAAAAALALLHPGSARQLRAACESLRRWRAGGCGW